MIGAPLALVAFGAAVVAFGAAVYFVLWPFAVEMVTQVRLLPRVERRIGAYIVSPTVKVGGWYREVKAFASVVPGGACSKAGITSDDIIVSEESIGSLCKRLQGPAGTRVVVEVVPGGPGPKIEERPKRQVVIVLP